MALWSALVVTVDALVCVYEWVGVGVCFCHSFLSLYSFFVFFCSLFYVFSFFNGITNTNGLFTLSDVEVSENTTFTATYSNISATCTVEKCLFVDYATNSNYNTNWDKTPNITLVRDENYTTVSNSSSSSGQYKPDNWASYSGDIAIEWDNWATAYQSNYFIVTGSTDVPKTFGALYINKPCKVKITIVDTTLKCYIDGVDKATYTINRDSDDNVKVRLQINPTGDDIKYSNFRMYSID